jgi:hypothetical protein
MSQSLSYEDVARSEILRQGSGVGGFFLRLAGVMAASAVIPGIGGLVVAIWWWRLHQAEQSEKIRFGEALEAGVVAPYLPSDELEKYEKVHGKERIVQEKELARSLNALPRKYKEEFEGENSTPVPPATVAHVESPARLTERSLGILCQVPKSTLYLAHPGAGKGVLVSNAALGMKAQHPEIVIYAIDPKNDAGERGFWESGNFDVVRHINPLQQSGRFCRELITYLREIQDLINANQAVLFVLDECVIVSDHLKAGGEWGTEAQQLLETLSTWFVSGGSSRRCFAWFISQSPLDKALPFATYNRSQLRIAVLLREASGLASLNSSNPPFVPKELCRPELVEDAIEMSHEIMEADSRPKKSGRALYLSDFKGWLPMVPLKILSATDRDRGEYFEAPAEILESEESPFPEFEPEPTPAEAPPPVIPEIAEAEQPFEVSLEAIQRALIKLGGRGTSPQIYDKVARGAKLQPDGKLVSRTAFRERLDSLVSEGKLKGEKSGKTTIYAQ